MRLILPLLLATWARAQSFESAPFSYAAAAPAAVTVASGTSTVAQNSGSGRVSVVFSSVGPTAVGMPFTITLQIDGGPPMVWAAGVRPHPSLGSVVDTPPIVAMHYSQSYKVTVSGFGGAPGLLRAAVIEEAMR